MAKVKLTVRVEADLKAQFEGWAVERERSVSWLVEQAMTRMRNELLGRKADVSQPVEVVEVPPPGESVVSHGTKHRHRYLEKLDRPLEYDQGTAYEWARCECGETIRQKVR